MKIGRSIFLKIGLPLVVLVILVWQGSKYFVEAEPIRVGIMHNLSGPLTANEQSMVNATQMAIDEINSEGGLLDGRPVELIVVDCRSDNDRFAFAADSLITQEKISTIFGCFTSASRKTALPVFEQHNHLLYYPIYYEGAERSEHVIYLGSTPNQRILPALKWAFLEGHRRFHLVGSDYIYPHTANMVIKGQLNKWKATITGEDYFLLGNTQGDQIRQSIEHIKATKPDMIINNMVGPEYVVFLDSLRAAGITSDSIPMISFGLTEGLMRNFEQNKIITNRKDWEGDFVAATYFQNIDDSDNHEFVKRYKRRFGARQVTDDFVEAHYTAVHLWAAAVERAGSSNVDAIREQASNISYKGPGGMVHIDSDNHHIWRQMLIGQINEELLIDVIYESRNPIRPIPYLELWGTRFTQPEDWDNYLQELYKGWGNQWTNPGPAP